MRSFLSWTAHRSCPSRLTLLLLLPCFSASVPFRPFASRLRQRNDGALTNHPWIRLRSGSQPHDPSQQDQGSAVTPITHTREEIHSDHHDEERYSRQVYALGARAHSLIRSATVLLDGPSTSGLLYETAKNLALSGVSRIVLLESHADNTEDSSYINGSLDDLGRAFGRAAVAEVGGEAPSNLRVLQEYLQRLNPSVHVTVMPRADLSSLPPSGAGRTVLVVVDRPMSTQMTLNRQCRALDYAFCAVDTAGVYGILFSDFGKEFVVDDPDGETPLATPLEKLALQEDGSVAVHCVEGERHDVSKGDVVHFKFRDGTICPVACHVEKVASHFGFQVRIDDADTDKESFVALMNQQAATFSRTKQPLTLQFRPMHEAIERIRTDESIFTACDLDKSFDFVRRTASVASFQTLSAFVEEKGRLPEASEQKLFFDLLKTRFWPDMPDEARKQAKRHCRNFCRGCRAKFVPMQALFGAIAAQEALKAVSGLYRPVHQFLLYDCDEVLQQSQSKDTIMEDCGEVGEDVPGLRTILGDAVIKRLVNQKIFVVGAGAIGCELMKNLAAMGVASGQKGQVHVTDMDTIEKSNLSRQFLFRDTDIGSFKSVAAHRAITAFNPRLNIEPHSSRVGDASDTPFDEDFWTNEVDIVLNALDNVEARLFIDRQCVAHQKALVDSGTLGPKGNTQVVVPHQSESYASSADPPEQAIPVCTLKNFPYSISHTIQWGRDLFDGLFLSRPTQANDFLERMSRQPLESVVQTLTTEHGADSVLRMLPDLTEDLKVTRGDDIKNICLRWAVELSRTLFFQSAIELMEKHPLDSLDDDGEPFWTGVRRPPIPLAYVKDTDGSGQESANENLVRFVKTAARLRMATITDEEYMDISDDDARDALLAAVHSAGEAGDNVAASIQSRMALLQGIECRRENLNAIEFEKDDDSNGHVDFITAASNLRAISYGIPPVDAMETRRVAGNIIPAMITTTAFVAAVSCLELVKLTQGVPLGLHRNAFINLALPFFAFTPPLPAEEIPWLDGKTFTIWDRLLIKEKKKDAKTGGLLLRSLLERIEKKFSDGRSIAVSSISLGEYMLYANYLHQEDDNLLNSSLWDIIEQSILAEEEFAGRDQPSNPQSISFGRSVDLAVTVEDLKTGEEVETPPVRVIRHSSSAC